MTSAPSTVEEELSRCELKLGMSFAEAIGKTFRGEIWENSKGVPMGRGYANEGEPFDPQSACYLKHVMKAIREKPFGTFVIKAAVQTLKTFGTIEEPAAYFMQHDPGDMGIYFSGDDVGFDQSKSRFTPRLRSMPGVEAMLAAAEEEDQNMITTAKFFLRNMVLRVMPLNESTTQRITLRYVMISDAFLAKRTGLIKQAKARTTQHNSTRVKDYKIIIESQGCDKGDDFETEWKATDMAEIHTVCPHCGKGQQWDWSRERGADFEATLSRQKVAEVMVDTEAVKRDLVIKLTEPVELMVQ